MVAAVNALVTGGTDWIRASGEDSIAMLAEGWRRCERQQRGE